MNPPSYFRVTCRRVGLRGSRWVGAATIVRADTDEAVERLRVGAATAADTAAALDAAIAGTLAGRPPPRDWGRDPTVPRLVQRWLRLRDEVYGMVLRAAPDAEAHDARELAKLRAQVAALTETQRLELATASAEELAAVDDPWILDTLTAKQALCRFIDGGSAAVLAAQARLQEALDREPEVGDRAGTE